MKKTVTFAGVAASAVLLLITGLVILFEISYRGKTYPGVIVAGNRAGGLNENQVRDVLARQVNELGQLELRWGVNRWEIPADDLGVKYNLTMTAKNVLDFGRRGTLLDKTQAKISALTRGVALVPAVNYDLGRIDEAVASISSQINIPAREPEIIKTGVPPTILVSRGINGQEVNTSLLKDRIIATIIQLNKDEINIPVIDIKPQLSDEQAEKTKTEAEKLVGKIFTINFDGEKRIWKLEDEELLMWLDLHTGKWNRLKIKLWIEELAKTVDRPAQDASFRWIGKDKVEEFKPAKNGIKLNTTQMVSRVVSGLDELTGSGKDQTVELMIDYTEPDITNGDVNDLGIKELIGKGESWFTGSITNRIFNLKKAADVINGKLVAPGETFSFNQTVGEVSADTGYKQAYIIKEGKTILGDGGGVCQVSTTLFRAALNAGLPITTRTPHAYRVSYYEVNYQVGFDATVFQPAPDFRFVNDTPAHILIQADYDEEKKYLSFEIYGTSDDRVAEVSKARVWEVIAPPPDLYIDDPNLAIGKVVQTEHAARGAKVAFDWKVTRGEEVLQERTFFSNYRPWQAVYLRGTKAN